MWSILDKKQHRGLIGLGFLILISALLELVSVTALVPTAGAIMQYEKIIERLEDYGVSHALSESIQSMDKIKVIVTLLIFLMAVFIAKSLFMMLLVYQHQHAFCHEG